MRKCQLGEADTVGDGLAQRLDDVSEVDATSGEDDRMVTCDRLDGRAIGHFVTDQVQQTAGVADTFTLIGFNAFT